MQLYMPPNSTPQERADGEARFNANWQRFVNGQRDTTDYQNRQASPSQTAVATTTASQPASQADWWPGMRQPGGNPEQDAAWEAWQKRIPHSQMTREISNDLWAKKLAYFRRYFPEVSLPSSWNANTTITDQMYRPGWDGPFGYKPPPNTASQPSVAQPSLLEILIPQSAQPTPQNFQPPTQPAAPTPSLLDTWQGYAQQAGWTAPQPNQQAAPPALPAWFNQAPSWMQQQQAPMPTAQQTVAPSQMSLGQVQPQSPSSTTSWPGQRYQQPSLGGLNWSQQGQGQQQGQQFNQQPLQTGQQSMGGRYGQRRQQGLGMLGQALIA